MYFLVYLLYKSVIQAFGLTYNLTLDSLKKKHNSH